MNGFTGQLLRTQSQCKEIGKQHALSGVRLAQDTKSTYTYCVALHLQKLPLPNRIQVYNLRVGRLNLSLT